MTAAETDIVARLAEAMGRPPARSAPVTGLEVAAIGKRYGVTRALGNVSISFRPGSVHTILGENGSGKSTLLKLLSGVVPPSEGRMLWNGTELRPRSPLEMQRAGLTTVFQEVLVSPHRSVCENILLGYDGLLTRRIPTGRRHAVARTLLDALGETRIDTRAVVGDLPLAAQQLVVLARAFLKQPSVLLLDEATAALDYGDREKVFAAITDHARSGAVVIFVSHRMDEVRRLSDRVSVLRSGDLVETLERDEVTSERLLRLMAPEAHGHAA